MNEHMIALVIHACPGHFKKSRGMKSNLMKIVLALGAILFWVVALVAAFLFATIAVLWEKTRALMPWQQLVSRGSL
jgi:hypothetical protein